MADIDLRTARKSPARPRSTAADLTSKLPSLPSKGAGSTGGRRRGTSVDRAKVMTSLSPRRDAR
jgi:hypothetical protein